jgi:hypothetical protein
VTEPLPLPVAPALIVIHAALLVAVHAHPVAAVTLTVPPVTPAAGGLADAAPIVGAQGAPAWVTVNATPPTVIVAERAVVVGFAVTVYVTEPLPLPVAPALMVIHDALSVAVHAHPVTAVTATVFVLAPKPRLADAGAIVGAQGAPAWLTLKVLPAIVSVPVRGVVVGLAVTLNATDPLPVPVAPALMVIQPALLVALQPHAAVTATVPLPAVDVMFADAGEMVGVHGGVKLNVFDRALALLPPGPTAATTTS